MNNLTMSADEQPDTYPQPEDGWVCFHCGERFKKVGAAEDHFGVRSGDGLACRIKAGDERGLVMDLRKAQNQTRELQDKVDRGGCTFAGPKRGDCGHFIGLPGHAMPGQNDGPDDTVDHYGKPNGWCWACWRVEQIRQAEQAERQKILAEIADKDPTLHPDAMRRKTLEEALSAVGQKSPAVSRDEVLRILRALANQPSEPGEAA